MEKQPALSLQQQVQDYDLMIDILREACPVLMTYRNSEEVDQHFNRMRETLMDTSSMLDFYLHVQRTLSFFQDGHLQAYASNDLYAEINQLKGYLPLQLKFLDDRIYVWRNLTNSPHLSEGTEIKAINGIASQDIIEGIQQFISSDAGNTFFKQHKLNNEYRLYLAF